MATVGDWPRAPISKSYPPRLGGRHLAHGRHAARSRRNVVRAPRCGMERRGPCHQVREVLLIELQPHTPSTRIMRSGGKAPRSDRRYVHAQIGSDYESLKGIRWRGGHSLPEVLDSVSLETVILEGARARHRQDPYARPGHLTHLEMGRRKMVLESAGTQRGLYEAAMDVQARPGHLAGGGRVVANAHEAQRAWVWASSCKRPKCRDGTRP